MKKLLLCMVLSLFAGISFGQVSKSDATAATLNASIATRNFTFTSGEFGGCASLTEVEVDLTLTVTDNSGCNPGVFGVHSDIAVSLESPSGTVVHLVQDFTGILIGSPPIGITYQDATFPNIVNETATYDDDAVLLADNQTSFGVGTWRPHNPLSAFDGEDPAGTWILRVADGRNQGFPDFTCYVGATVRVSCGAICTDPTVPTLTQAPSTVCVGGTASLNITGSLNDATAWNIYTGSCGGTFIGSTAVGSFAIPGVINTPTTYFVRGEGGCVLPGSCGTITITPQAADDASFSYSAASYCVNETDPTPTVTGVGGGGFTSVPLGLSINSGTGAIDLSASIPNTYSVTYTTTGACPNSSNVTVTVNALDNASFNYSASSYCATDVDPTPTITGLAGGGFTSTPGGLSLNAASGVIDVSTSTPGTYTVTYSTTGPCANSSSVSVTIQSATAATFTALADLCINAGVQAGLGGGAPTGGVYSGPGVTDNGNGMTYSFDPAAAGVVVHTITYTPVGGCVTAGTDQVEVFALPTVTFTALSDLCIDAGVQAGLGSGSPTGGVYSGTGVTDDGNGMTYSFDPAAAGVGTHTITYTFTNANGCTSSTSDQVEVFALPTVTFTALADLCINDGVQAGLGGGNPMGGVYSGAGVTDDGNGMTYSFDPAVAGVGTHTITYAFTNANGCNSSATDDVEVFALPTATYTAPGPFCLTQGVQTGLGGGTPMGGVYSGAGVTDDGNGMTYSFDPAAAGVGSHTVTYTVGVSGCVGSASGDIVVSAGGAVTAVCQDVTIFLDANGDASITAADIDGGSSVGCGVLNLAASQTAFTCADVTLGPVPLNDLVISGVYDGPLTGGTPKGVELYVINDIADLSQYGLGSANNGGGTDGEEFTFPAVSATAGQFIYVSSEAPQFTNWFGFAPDYTDGSMSINGDDAVELFYQGGVIDIFGDINTDGNGEVWEYLDGWAYRNNDTGPDGSAWTPGNWTYSGINVLDGETSNGTAVTPFPTGTYSITVATPSSVTLTVTDGLGGSATCTANVTVLDTVSPIASCQDATVYLDATGNATITSGELESAGASAQKLYFTTTNSNELYEGSKDGSTVPVVLYAPAASSSQGPVGVDYIEQTDELIWAGGNNQETWKAPADGSGTPFSMPNSQGVFAEHHDQEVDFANSRYFFTTNNGGIYVGNLDGSGTAVQISATTSDVNAVEYDPATQTVFTNSVNGDEIYSMNDNGTGLVTLFDGADGVSGPRGIVLDEAAGVLYWTNRGSGEIMSGNADGSGTTTVLYTGRTGLYQITLDPLTDMLFWTEFGSSDRIITAPKSGAGTPAEVYNGTFGGIRGITLGAGPLGASHSDNCSAITTTIDVSNFDCSNVGTPVTVTSTVTDASGNTATCTSQVTVLDTISPTITCPVDIIQDQDAGVCSADVTVPSITTADNCSGETFAWTVSGSTTATGTGQPGVQTFNVGVSTVDVTATDASGNTANCSFLVTVNDTVAPTLPVLADSIGECSVTVAAPTTTDNCNGTITGTTTDPTTVTTQGTSVITWTFDDGSGNVTTATQNVIINDAIAPTASNIDTAFAECIGDVAIDITLVDDEADNCTAAPVVAYVGDVASNGTGCNDTVVRTYSVTDDGGNSINVEQIIILNDVTAPTASNPITLNVVCLAEVPDTTGAASWVTDEADNCGNPTVTWLSDVSSNGTGCNDTILRTFEVADACGNSIQVQQMIIVNDDDAPVLDVATLADVTGTCDVTPVAPTATDNCAGSLNGVPDVTFPISAVGTTVVTWTYTDNCGNSVSQTQNVIVTGVDAGTTMASDNITMIATNTNAGVTYQWYDCVSGTIVAGETNVNFTPSYGSDFAVIVTENGCADTSACVNSTVGIDQLTLNQFTMFPNPTENGSFSIQLDTELKEVSVLEMTGRLVEVEVDLTEKRVNVSNLVNGAYIVRVVTETEQELVGTIRVQ